MITVIVQESIYFSQGDEDSFYGWLNRIDCVAKVKGEADGLHISIREKGMNIANLEELIGLFHRYGIDKRQLAQFENSKNTTWFRDKDKFWYRDVFR